jgi:hypothetical protein
VSAAAVVLLVLLVAGCQVRTEVDITVEDDGSGKVEVGVGLDAEAVAELPDLDRNGVSDAADLGVLVRTDDLRATGWDIGAPSADSDGYTWIRATKPFGTPEEAAAVLNELTGANGPLRDWSLSREHSFGKTTYDFAGTADLSGGIEAFGDEDLAAALDGEPLGEDATAIEQRYGAPLSDMLTLKIRASLPGSSTKTWSPTLNGAPVTLKADSTVYNTPVLALAATAALAVVALIAVATIRLLRSRQS